MLSGDHKIVYFSQFTSASISNLLHLSLSSLFTILLGRAPYKFSILIVHFTSAYYIEPLVIDTIEPWETEIWRNSFRFYIVCEFEALANKKNHAALSCFIRFTMDIWNWLNQITRKYSLFSFILPYFRTNKVTEHTTKQRHKNNSMKIFISRTNKRCLNQLKLALFLFL